MDAASKATIALQKAQATQIYAGLDLWPDATVARLVEAQLNEDGTYPGAEQIFADAAGTPRPATDFDPNQPRDPQGRWTAGGEGGAVASPIDPRILGQNNKPHAGRGAPNARAYAETYPINHQDPRGPQRNSGNPSKTGGNTPVTRLADVIYICVGVEGGKHWRKYQCPDGSIITMTGSDLQGFIRMPGDPRG